MTRRRLQPTAGVAAIALLAAFAMIGPSSCGTRVPADTTATPPDRKPPVAPQAARTLEAGHVRTLFLIRHGVYDEEDPRDPDVGRGLVPLGREQATVTGERLAALPMGIDALHASTMTRARQTAEIIGKALGLEPRLSRDIRECTPPTVREDVLARLSAEESAACQSTLERAWARYFRPSLDRDSSEVIVCHGNVIRYFTSRALGLDPVLWLNMAIANCSVTTVEVHPDGATRLISFGDFGHLPPALQAYPGTRRPGGAQGKR